MTSAEPLRTVATSEWVVPRSMPTASRRWCGSGLSPGSEICSRAMSGHRLVDLRLQLLQETQLAHQRAAGVEVRIAIDGALQLRQHVGARARELAAHGLQLRVIALRAGLGHGFAPFH